MSEENVETVRKVVEIINAREVPEDLIEPDIQIQNVPTAVTDNLYVGAEGIREWQEDFLAVMDETGRFGIDEVLAHEGDVVVVKVQLVGHGRASSAPLDIRWFIVCWVRDGRIARTDSYASRREALKAAGLSE
jgi:ketosteroid isomerase-like protein